MDILKHVTEKIQEIEDRNESLEEQLEEANERIKKLKERRLKAGQDRDFWYEKWVSVSERQDWGLDSRIVSHRLEIKCLKEVINVLRKQLAKKEHCQE